jgi:hypothetical protein
MFDIPQPLPARASTVRVLLCDFGSFGSFDFVVDVSVDFLLSEFPYPPDLERNYLLFFYQGIKRVPAYAECLASVRKR